jgi:steroid delta-isomerase-like uncharacterized protein
MTQPTEQDARQLVAVVNTRNVDKLVEQYADDATFQVPGLAKPIHGKVEIRGFLAGNFAAFPDWKMDVSKVIVQGNDVVLVNSVGGTHTGPMVSPEGKPIAPTNKKFAQELMTRVVWNDKGKVQSLRAYGNATERDQQLGLSK